MTAAAATAQGRQAARAAQAITAAHACGLAKTGSGMHVGRAAYLRLLDPQALPLAAAGRLGSVTRHP